MANTTLSNAEIGAQMSELMAPIDEAMATIESREQALMLACAMLQRTREIFDATLGEEGRKEMFRPLAHTVN